MNLQCSPGTGGRLVVPHLVRRADRHRQVERGGSEEAGGAEFPASVAGCGENTGRVQEGEHTAVRRRVAAEAEE
jgi:hypothetical protein